MNLGKFSSIALHALSFVAFITQLFTVSACFAARPERPAHPKSIRVVMDDSYPPYVYKDEQGALKGIIVDQWKLWEKKTGIPVNVTGMDWGEAQRRMQAGEYDVIDTMFKNERRETIYDFSRPYARLDVPLFFHKDISGISGAADLKGFLVAAKTGDSSLDVLKKFGVTNIAEYPSYEKLIESARDGKTKVFTVDRPPALYFLNKMGIQNHYRETRPLYFGEFHRAVRKGDTALLSTVENGFAAISNDEYNAIDNKWMGSSLPSAPYLRYVFYGAGVVAVFLLILVVWLWTLKRAVSIKTRELAESERRHRDILQSAMIGVLLIDTHGRILEVNKAYCSMSGYSEQELLSMGIPDLDVNVSADDIAGRIQVVKKRGDMHFESRHRRKDGAVFDVEASVQYRPDNGGQCLTFMQDISERKQMELELQKSKALFEAVVENVPLMIFLKEATDLRFVLFNRAGEELVGYDRETFLGKNNLDLFPPEEAANFMAKDREALAMESGVVDIPEEPITTAKKGLRFLHTRKVSIRGGDGVSKFLLGISEDITDRKRADEERQNFEQQMQHTQKLESLGILSGGIAHDFNNILAIIMGYCALTKMDYETAEQNIPEIEKAVERAAALCRQMLAYAGKAQITKTQVNLVTMIDEMVSMLKSTLPQNAVINTDLSADIPCIYADSSQLRQILMNLIINASEAIGTEQGEISVSLARCALIAGQADRDFQGKTIPSGEYVCLEVTDNGCGMDEATKWRIFEPFYTTKFAGRGLGMSAVLGIINSHGGALQLFSRPGQGTTFKVYLPIQSGEPVEVESPVQSATSAQWQGSGTILLAEDEDQIRFFARSMLELFGFIVLEAQNGREALAIYQENAADIRLVLTDLGMPVMDGYELFQQLKKLDPELPIIISSGFGDTDVASRIGSENIAGMINKPYYLSEMREVLKKGLEGSQKT